MVQYILPNDTVLHFNTDSRLFSPNSIDKGTLAMLQNTLITAEDKVLDLGCGYGFVGVYIASLMPVQKIVMCDVDPIAIEYARENARLNGLQHLEIIQSDALESIKDFDFSVILSNPPYHTDFSVAKRFIEQGFAHLQQNGRLVMVVKRLLWYKNKMTSVFGGVRIKQIDDYYVLTAEKRSELGQRKIDKKIKPKHQKRMEKTRSNKRK